MITNTEQQRLKDAEKTGNENAWKKWGPYVTERQWGTVREDYSTSGDAWNYITHDMARSKAYRWGEEGIAGISDNNQYLCFAPAFWNGKDPIIKERLYGVSGPEGNHGEDVKELYYYLDATPTHSYMKMLYKYPMNEFPYRWLSEENRKRNRNDDEFELLDTGIFNNDEYFDIFIEYAKNNPDDLLIKISIHNRSNKEASLNVLPTLWFRNRWSWGYGYEKPTLENNNGNITAHHATLGDYILYAERADSLLFCENETNVQRLYNSPNQGKYYKDGINDYLINGNKKAVNNSTGTKAAFDCRITINPNDQAVIRLRLTNKQQPAPFDHFDDVVALRIKEADAFYNNIQSQLNNADERLVQRQAFAGMLWSKQFYKYNVQQWLDGDPAQPAPPQERKKGRNNDWPHLNNSDIISMPDKWEYPWYAAWDLAFHCLPFAVIDASFAKQQLLLLTKEWFMHPRGQLPAYEWAFSDANPPVHAWATWRVYKIDQKNNNGDGDIAFLESVFHKLLMNFTWWVNRKDAEGNNIFQGGFLGLDNIGVFDRNTPLPAGGFIEQADGTSWMAMYSLNLMRIAMELALHNPVYQDMATKFFEHFLYIAGAMASMGDEATGLWDTEDEFYYDVLKCPNDGTIKLKVRSMVGLIPLFAVEVIEHEFLLQVPEFAQRLNWFLDNRPQLASLVSRWYEQGIAEKHLLSLLRGHRMKRILKRMLDEHEFLSEYGIRSLSKYHEEHPFELDMNGTHLSVNYSPGESTISMFGGNSNWRGPVWMPVNFLIIESLQRFHVYYGEDFKVECPTGSGNYLTLNEIAEFLTKRLTKLFIQDSNGKRATYNGYDKMQYDPHFKDYVLFFEYFHADTGRGMGASHQTGWTGLIAKLLQPRRTEY